MSRLAKKRKISLISADSVQVFRYLDIASAKPSREERKRFPHYLIDIKSPFEPFNVSDFVCLADRAVEDCFQQGRVPVVCGGSAYYLKSFMYGLSPAPASDPDVRGRLLTTLKERGLAFLYQWLLRVDSISADRIGPFNTHRIIRALEVFLQTGRPLSDFKTPSVLRKGFEFRIVALLRRKEDLVLRIRRRLDDMFKSGLADEISSLKRMGLTLEHQSMNSIGYREFFQDDDINRIRQAIEADTVHYAKRQMTFFRSLERGDQVPIRWILMKENLVG